MSKAVRGMAVRMGKGKPDGGKGTGDQWEAKQNKFMLRRGRSRRRSGSEEQKIWKRRRETYKQEEARPSVGAEFLGKTNKRNVPLKVVRPPQVRIASSDIVYLTEPCLHLKEREL